MSRNRHTRMSPVMANGQIGTAYAPDAEGGSADLRVDQLGTSYAPDAEGGSADLRVDQLGSQQRRLRDDVRLRDFMGVSAYDMEGQEGEQGAEGFSEGSAEGGRVQQLGTGQPRMLVSNGRIGGLREDDADLRMGISSYDELNGLREDDADLRMGVSAYDMEGLREDDADLRMGHNPREDYQNIRLRGLREDDADLRLQGLREDDASVRMGGLREDDAGLVLGVLRGLREDDSDLKLGSVRSAMILRGAGDINTVMGVIGRKMRRFHPGKTGHYGKDAYSGGYAERFKHLREGRPRIAAVLAAEDFHPRWPVTLQIDGLGTIRTTMGQAQMGGIFDFLSSGPSAEEYMGKLQTIANTWAKLAPRLASLPQVSQQSIINNANTAQTPVSDLQNTLPLYIQDGYAGYQSFSGRWDRIKRWEAYLPTMDKLISQAETLGRLTPAQANQTAVQDVAQRIDASASGGLSTAAAVGIGIISAGALTGLVIALA